MSDKLTPNLEFGRPKFTVLSLFPIKNWIYFIFTYGRYSHHVATL